MDDMTDTEATPHKRHRGLTAAKRSKGRPKEVNEWYVEPEWCSQRLFELVKFQGAVWDPFAGSGRIVRAAQATGLASFGTDILDRGYLEGLQEHNFVLTSPDSTPLDNIVTFPPLATMTPDEVPKSSDDIVQLALRVTTGRVAMLLPFRWCVGDTRSAWLATTPLRWVLVLTPRPLLDPGQIVFRAPDKFLLGRAEDYYDNAPANGNSDVAWYVWEHGYQGKAELDWCWRDP